MLHSVVVEILYVCYECIVKSKRFRKTYTNFSLNKVPIFTQKVFPKVSKLRGCIEIDFFNVKYILNITVL